MESNGQKSNHGQNLEKKRKSDRDKMWSIDEISAFDKWLIQHVLNALMLIIFRDKRHRMMRLRFHFASSIVEFFIVHCSLFTDKHGPFSHI